MNILMALSQREITGAEVYAATLSDQLIDRGHNVFIVSDTLTVKCKAPFFPLEFNNRFLSARVGHIIKLCKLIKEHDIQVVHAHSRASSWVCSVACMICRIPLITTTHGRQPVHASRRLIKAFGVKSICVCENIRTQICKELGYDEASTLLLRNPVDPSVFTFSASDRDLSRQNTTPSGSSGTDTAGTVADSAAPAGTDADSAALSAAAAGQSSPRPIRVALVGRLSGPKGHVAYEVLSKLSPHEHIHIQIIGSKDIPERFDSFRNLANVEFLGYRTDVHQLMRKADVIVGAGRVGVEAVLSGRPLIAVGEAIYEGLVTTSSLAAALSSNFGDINCVNETRLDFSSLKDDVEAAVNLSVQELSSLRETVLHEFNMERIVSTIEELYSRTFVEYRHYEVPVLMYHRVIESEAEAGVHGTWVTRERFESHLKLLKSKGYQTVTFKELAENNLMLKRFDRGNKFIVLTFDDGYEDNYRVMFPVLKKYGAKAVIFLLSDSTCNAWDADNAERPEKRLSLMTPEQIKEMEVYGVEFGAHTRTHPRLSQLPLEQARDEIAGCRQSLEQTYGHSFTTFAYPYGDLNEAVKEEVKKAGFTYALATDSGNINMDSDPFQIRRIAIFPRNSMLTFRRKISGRYNFIKMKREEKAYGHHN